MTNVKTVYINQLAAESAGISQLIEFIEKEITTNTADIGIIVPYLGTLRDQIIFAVRKFMARELTAFLNSPDYSPARLRGTDICIFENKYIQVNIGLISDKARNSPNLFSLPSDLIVMNLGAEDFSIIPHRIPTNCNFSVFDVTQALDRGTEARIGTGEICLINAGEFVPEFVVNQDSMVLKIFSTRQSPLGWVYNKENLKPLFASSTSNDANRLQVVSRLLSLWTKEFGIDQTSLTILKKIAVHNAHFVRWTAIQNLFAIAPEEGVEFLEKALNDEHPHIRQAAKSSWNRLYGSEKAIQIS